MNPSENNLNPLAQNFSLFSLLRFAFPTITMMLFMGLYTIIDTIFVSRFVNTDALSAINIVCPVINLIVGLGTMIATGGSAIVARKLGAGNIKRANQDFTLIVIFGAVLSFLLMTLGIIFIDKIIWRLGASEVLFPYCKDYLFIILLFTPASMLQVLFQNLIVTAGKPAFGMFLSLGAGIINIMLDYIFIVFFNLGIIGSALGTGISYMIPSILGILFFAHEKGALSFEKPVIDFSILTESCMNGSSEMISQISTATTTLLFNLTMMELLGESGVAAITIIIYTQFLLTTLYIGFSMGIAPIISFNFGAKNYNCLKKVYKICISFVTFSSILIFLLSIILKNSLIQLFTTNETDIFRITATGFRIFKYSFLFSGFNIFSSASFTALSDGKISAIISFLRTFGFIMISLLVFPIFLGITGVWLAVPIAEFLTFCIAVFLIWVHRKKYQYI